MKLTEIGIKQFTLPFKKPFETAQGEYSKRTGIHIYGSNGVITGIGEASPLPGFSNETLSETIHVCNHFIKYVLHREFAFDEMMHHIQRLVSEFPSLRFGLETMVLDFVSKSKGVSISQYLNSDAFDECKQNGIVGYHLPSDNFDVMKMKIGMSSLENDIAKIHNFTHEFGENVALRLDANGSLTLKEALAYCEKLKPFNIDYLEQPLPKGNLRELTQLCNHTTIPIAVDESLTDVESAKEIIKHTSVDVFVIKPTITGGVYESNRIVQLAKKHSIRSIITSTLESSIGLSACSELAKANQITDACGLSTDILFELDSILYVN